MGQPMPVLLMGSLAILPPGTHIACAVHIITLLHVSFLYFSACHPILGTFPRHFKVSGWLVVFSGERQTEDQVETLSRLHLFRDTNEGQVSRAGSPWPCIQSVDSFSWDGGHREGLGQVQSRWHYTKPLTTCAVSKGDWTPYLLHIRERENVKQNGNWEGSAVTVDTL